MNRNGWEDKRSKVDVEKTPEGDVTKITGKYWHNDVEFNFRLTRQSKGEYIMRGQCSIVSPRDGRVLQVQGQERRLRLKRLQENEPILDLDGQLRLKLDDDENNTESENKKAKRRKELNATEALYVKSDDLETIKKLISRKVEKMYGVNILAIEDSINLTVTTQNIHSAQAVRMYAAKYISNCCSVSKKVSKSYISTLIHAGSVLDNCQMGDLKQSDIRALEKSFDKGAKKKIQIVKRFWDYARDLGLYSGPNPFDIYTLKNGKNTRSAEALQRESVTFKSLPIDVEKKLNQRISENLNDGRIQGLILVKG